MRVLLTGATGFIGKHCLKRLQEMGCETYAVSSKEADLLEQSQVRSMMAKVRPTHLLHCAWYVEHGKFWNASQNANWVQGSLNLVHSFLDTGGKRLVVTGTCAEYEWGHPLCSEKSTPLLPASYYGVCKNALRSILEHYQGLDWAWGRIFYPFGPYEKKTRFVPSIIEAIKQKSPATYSGGERVRDFLYAEDIADALVTLLTSDVQGPINIASGAPCTISALCEHIAQQLDGLDYLQSNTAPLPPNDPPVLLADVTRLNHELGWRPKWKLQEALNHYIKLKETHEIHH